MLAKLKALVKIKIGVGTKRLSLGTIFILVFLAGGLYYFIDSRQKEPGPPPAAQEAPNAADANIVRYKDSQNPQELRTLLNAYLMNSQYDQAVSTAKKIAGMTGAFEDHLAVLNVCASRQVAARQQCVDETAAKLRPHIGRLTFSNAYSIGAMLEQTGQRKAAAEYYERAYQVYDATRADEYTKSKEQLRNHINELNK